jgi:hypothetical protein
LAAGMIGDEENLVVANGRAEVEINSFEVLKVFGDKLNTALGDLAPFDFKSGEVPEPGSDH